jgi:riboflavin synthase
VFTGLIEEVGSVVAPGAKLRIAARTVMEGMRIGDSICVNGVCLTAVEMDAAGFRADAAPETLRRSNLGDLRAGSPVNLERSMSPSARFGGHIVQGHVDGVGRILSLQELGDGNWWLRVQLPAELERYVVFKGSLCIDGISLTLAEVEGPTVAVSVIPHTYRNTVLCHRRAGDTVNIETDILAKYVEKMLRSLDVKTALTIERLKERGY